ncbi:MAG: hypothetical protein R3B41_04305 [Candidatus Doudnabacteria bacterium]
MMDKVTKFTSGIVGISLAIDVTLMTKVLGFGLLDAIQYTIVVLTSVVISGLITIFVGSVLIGITSQRKIHLVLVAILALVFVGFFGTHFYKNLVGLYLIKEVRVEFVRMVEIKRSLLFFKKDDRSVRTEIERRFGSKLDHLIKQRDEILEENNLRVIGNDPWIVELHSGADDQYFGMIDVYTTDN